MDKQIRDLDGVLAKLVCLRPFNPLRTLPSDPVNQRNLLERLNLGVDKMELVLSEAHRAKGWQWVEEEPLWTSWSLNRFGASARFAHPVTHSKLLPASHDDTTDHSCLS